MFGTDNLLGWNVCVRDGDGHKIRSEDGQVENVNRPITVGDHVWLASNVDLLKGSFIPSGCIVGWRSIVTRQFYEKNSIIAGIPAKVVKNDIIWSV